MELERPYRIPTECDECKQPAKWIVRYDQGLAWLCTKHKLQFEADWKTKASEERPT